MVVFAVVVVVLGEQILLSSLPSLTRDSYIISSFLCGRVVKGWGMG